MVAPLFLRSSRPALPQYTELHAHSAFTFLEATDFPADLVRGASELGLSGLGILDVDGMYSAVQTARAGKTYSLPIIHGVELTLSHIDIDDPSAQGGSGFVRMVGDNGSFSQRRQKREGISTASSVRIQKGMGLKKGSDDPGLRLPVLARSQSGYHTLCSLLSAHFLAEPGRRKARLNLNEVEQFAHQKWDLFALTGTAHGPLRRALAEHGIRGAHHVLDQLKETFGPSNVAVELQIQAHDPPGLAQTLALLAQESNLPLVAAGAVRSTGPERFALADVLSATRLGVSLDEAEPHLPAFRSFLRSPKEMSEIFTRYPQAIDNAVAVGQECAFSLDLIEPGLPSFPVPEGHSEATWLRHVTYLGAEHHYGSREQNRPAWDLIDHELQIIEQLGFPGYFLIVKDIVDYCRRKNILCQGRGSAANSAVCYALRITAVDAVKHEMLFERFLSPDRVEAPDIDLDIEADEREQVIQYVYETYGRSNAAQVANVISYRPKSAVRDAGKAFGYPEGAVRRWSKFVRRSRRGPAPNPAEETRPNQNFGDDPHKGEVPAEVLEMASQLQRLPRHMGLHPGGMVLTNKPVSQVCPVMWAAKEGRTVLQWDKEDCADAGLVKFDLLGLGMLTALRKAYNWLEDEGIQRNGRPLDLHNLPDEDPLVYNLLCAADTVGVFQVESRAQMNTLPRLKPRCFYDIVIEVALIRPGPIQGRAVNPYLRRRNGREKVRYLHPLLEPSLKKTLGVPLFQEQLMQMAVDVAGFTPSQADMLRRAIGAKRSEDRMVALKPALYKGMEARNVAPEIQAAIFEQLKGFAEFGFPESHAFSFAYLVYASAWLKVHYPEHFYAGLLSSQPMGFYSPATLVEDAKRHGVLVNPPSVVYSSLETVPEVCPEKDGGISHRVRETSVSDLVHPHPGRAVRIGLETIKGLGEGAKRICDARLDGPWESLADLASRARLNESQMEKLSRAGALEDLGMSRRQGLWGASVVGRPQWEQPYIPGTEPGMVAPSLPEMTEVERVTSDYASLGLSTQKHPMEFAREELSNLGVVPLVHLGEAAHGSRVRVGGVVTHRQRPGTAGGTTFLSLEDETGLANVICSKGLWARYRNVALESSALIVRGRVEQGDGATALVAEKLEPLNLPAKTKSRDFR